MGAVDTRRWVGYRDDPVGFASDVLGAELWGKQREILESVRDYDRVAVRSCNGSGKTFVAAHAVLWWLFTRPEGVAITTAPTRRQVEDLLWREIRGSYHKNMDSLWGDLRRTRLEVSPRNFAMGFSTNKVERLQGFHAEELLFVVDEASGVSDDIFAAIRSTMTSAVGKTLMIGNPTNRYGNFYQAFHGHGAHWHQIAVTAFDWIGSEDKPSRAKSRLVTQSWVDQLREMEGVDSAEYQVRVLGNFALEGADSLISVSDIETAIKRWERTELRIKRYGDLAKPDKSMPMVVGVDVARFGNDRSVACARRGRRVDQIEAWRRVDTMTTAKRVFEFATGKGAEVIVVDESGVGGGVLDRLRNLCEESGSGISCVGINGARQARKKESFANLRAELFWGLKTRFHQRDIELPNDRQMVSELSGLRYEFSSRGQLQLKDKRKYSGSYGGSPDKADALMLAFADHASEGRMVLSFL